MNTTFYTIILFIVGRYIINCLKTSKNGFLKWGFIVNMNVIITRMIIHSA